MKMALSKINMDFEKLDQCDQEKYLRAATQYFRGIDHPLKYGPVIDTLTDLIAALHKEFATNYVNIEMVNHIMLSYKSNQKEWRKFAKFDRYTYTRNLVDEGNGKFNLMILCWGEGHGSTIHDHADSHCFMKMIKGELREIRYEYPQRLTGGDDGAPDAAVTELEQKCALNERELREIGRKPLLLNDVAYINDNLGLHRVENPSHTDTAVSLHLYCPPFDTCHIFQKNTCKGTAAKVTFWSKHGVRTKTSE